MIEINNNNDAVTESRLKKQEKRSIAMEARQAVMDLPMRETRELTAIA